LKIRLNPMDIVLNPMKIRLYSLKIRLNPMDIVLNPMKIRLNPLDLSRFYNNLLTPYFHFSINYQNLMAIKHQKILVLFDFRRVLHDFLDLIKI
jgi:hypothetical protein